MTLSLRLLLGTLLIGLAGPCGSSSAGNYRATIFGALDGRAEGRAQVGYSSTFSSLDGKHFEVTLLLPDELPGSLKPYQGGSIFFAMKEPPSVGDYQILPMNLPFSRTAFMAMFLSSQSGIIWESQSGTVHVSRIAGTTLEGTFRAHFIKGTEAIDVVGELVVK